jgi:hypothetical protein
MRRAILAIVLVACGGHAEPAPAPARAIDRSAGERPDGTLVEVSIDGGDEALAELIARLPSIPERAALPSHVGALLDGLIDAPREIVAHVAAGSPLRLVMARIDGETRSAVAVRLDEDQASDRGDGPRGSTRVGERAAVDGRIAVVADDAAMLDRSFGYLAYTALATAHEDGVEVTLPTATLSGALRTALEREVDALRGRTMASIAAARAAHDRPPDVGDPEALVTLLADAARARIAYLPDLADAIVTLRTAPSGLAVSAHARVIDASPLAAALEGAASAPLELASSPPSSSAIVLATGLGSPTPDDVIGALAAMAGARLGAAERAALDEAARGVAAIGGSAHAIAIGAADSGAPFLVALTPDGTDAALPSPWGRAFPWTSALVGSLVGCAPVAARGTGDRAICSDVLVATRSEGGVRGDAIGRDAVATATSAIDRFTRHAPAASPDLARDLGALEASTFAIAVVRPLRALPLIALVSGAARTSLPRGDGAIVIGAARDGDALRVDLRASTASLGDLAALVDLFTDRE